MKGTFRTRNKKNKFSWTSITLFYIFFRYLWKSSQVLSRKKVFQTSAGLTKAHAAESFLSDTLEPCHLINKWTRMARDSLDALVYAHHETKLLEKLWKYINANHSSVRETVKGTSCATRHFLKCMDKCSLSIPLAFPLHRHCSLFKKNTSGGFLKAFPKKTVFFVCFPGHKSSVVDQQQQPKKRYVFCFALNNKTLRKRVLFLVCLKCTSSRKKDSAEVPRVRPKGHFTEVTVQHTSDVAISTT